MAATASQKAAPVGCFPPLQPTLFDRIRDLRWGTVIAVNLMSRVASPHLLFIGLRDGGPSASFWAGPPIRALGQGISWPLGQLVEINSNKEPT